MNIEKERDELLRLAQFLKDRQSWLGSSKDYCHREELSAWDDYEKAWTALERFAALDEQKMRVRENRPANVRTCLPVVHPVDTSPERIEETPKRGHDDVDLPRMPPPLTEFAYFGETVQDLFGRREMKAYARAAVLADREKRAALSAQEGKQ